ncbi:hypothetical protein VTN96DRAFT_350 [Rasamsonia emersonii]|uniref:Uncharacterized protein n=1 Tax=Rasamsonia emersonii (strain ATCC 16479 / CBS 393.64 / IMI 116815) TaxID=1408163 RepID=A0A0F4YMR8_RASE3|nr:hypothetical protein T310_6478 [Rasamsonia emersonii CBS 393.64]KKA19534.1 hypothetical protein T310_6478 [Rasamsonia emersonii CBS 393.64]
MASISPAWFKEKLAPDGCVEDGCHPDEAQALQEYIEGKTTAEQAAYTITRPVATSAEPGDNLHRLWGLLTDALVEWPSAEETSALIQLMAAIEHLPEESHLTDRARASLHHGPPWNGLPGFGHQWSDEHKRGDWRRTISEQQQITTSERAALRAKVVKIASIEAQMVAAGVGGIPLDWGYECISEALERSDAVLDFEIPMAAEWFKVAGRLIYEGAVHGERSWALEKRQDLWKGQKEMSLVRWEFWEGRLQGLAEQNETRDAAEEALRAMQVAKKEYVNGVS